MLFKYPIQSTAHGRITGSMKEIPIRSLINVPGYKAIPVRQGNIVYHEEYAFLPSELDQI
jgi:hypothetical protein